LPGFDVEIYVLVELSPVVFENEVITICSVTMFVIVFVLAVVIVRVLTSVATLEVVDSANDVEVIVAVVVSVVRAITVDVVEELEGRRPIEYPTTVPTTSATKRNRITRKFFPRVPDMWNSEILPRYKSGQEPTICLANSTFICIFLQIRPETHHRLS
jgi:hypothetical protein